MSFGAIAGAAIGLVGASMAADAAGDAAAASARVQREQLAFEREQYNDWKDIYGPLQEDLGTYYKNLTGQTLSDREVEQIQLAGQRADDKIQATLAQRGLTGSGLDAELTSQNIYKTEIEKARSRANADETANLKKMQFLSLGLGQGQGIMNQMGNTSRAASSAIMQGGAQQASIIGNATNNLQGIVGYAFNSGNSYTQPSYNAGTVAGVMNDNGIMY